MSELILLIPLFYLIINTVLFIGLRISIKLRQNDSIIYDSVSVIVAARNESANIKKCIDSLKKLKSDNIKTEIILVNDNSTDDTKEIMLNETLDFQNFRVIDSNNSQDKKLRGKTNAVDTGIKSATGKLIFLTDADCTVNENWINETLKYFDDNTTMVCGFTIIRHEGKIFNKLQAIDWLYLLTLASSSAGLKRILSCVGNNLSYTKRSYSNLGGYSNIDYSVTEDFALMRKFSSLNKIIKFPVNNTCLNYSEPCTNLSELYNQKKRWLRGGVKINLLGYLVGITLYAMNFLLLTGYIFFDIYLYFIIISIKIISELLLLLTSSKKLKLCELLVYFPLYELYLAIYGIILPFTFLEGRKIKWKGVEY